MGIEEAARAFLSAAFVALTEEGVLPPPRFRVHLRVGHHYYGEEVRVPEFGALESALESAFPNRFAEGLGHEREFASMYVFRFLEAAIALCALGRGPFRADSQGAEHAIESLIARLSAPEAEVVSCRFVSHLTTEDGQELAAANIEIVPQGDRDSRDYEDVARRVPDAGSVFDVEPPFVHDHPHAVVVARGTARNPWDGERETSADIERFRLLLRLLFASTVQSYWEVRGESSWVSLAPPTYVEFAATGLLGPMTRRTVRLRAEDVEPLIRLGEMLESVAVRRDDMAATSWDVALRNFSRAFVERAWRSS